MFLVYNSDILTDDAFRLPATDRAFQYGDGLFETIRYENDRIWFWPDHLARLTAGMAALHLNPPPGFDEITLEQQLRQLLSANGLLGQPARIKFQVWRQPGGLYTPDSQYINYLITAKPGLAFQFNEHTKIGIYNSFRLAFSPISAFKTLNSLPYVLAGLYKQQHGLHDVILLSTDGYLAECVASNLFWFQNDILHTPSLLTGCINGIARRQLLRLFPNAQAGLFLPDVLDNADVVFTANVMGINLVSSHLPDELRLQLSQVFTGLSA